MDEDELLVSAKLRELIQPGRTLKIKFSEDNINNKTIHICAVIDDDWIVYKYWAKRKKCWAYKVEYIYFFKLLYNDGTLLTG